LEFEVVVVGASSAGSYAAQLLAEQGVNVALFERDPDFAASPRTLIVTPTFSRVLNSGTPEAVTAHRSGTLRITSENCSKDISLVIPDYIVDRAAITKRLKESAEDSGAHLFGGYRFLSFIPTDRSVALLFSSSTGEIEVRATRAVIGADGALTNVGCKANIGRPSTVPILQSEIELPPGWDPDVTQVWFDANQTRYFYWLIPDSKTRAVVGLIGEKRARMAKLLQRFLGKHGFTARSFQAGQVAMYHPRFKPWARVENVPVMLVGDAAGQVKVTTVGGTVPGLLGAQAVTRSILHGSSYRRELFRLRRELDLHWWMRSALNRLDNQGYDFLVRSVSVRLSSFFGKHDRDSMTPVFWQLPLLEPRLLKVAASCFLGKRNRITVDDR